METAAVIAPRIRATTRPATRPNWSSGPETLEAVTAGRERSDRPPRWPTVAIRPPAGRTGRQSAPDQRSVHNRRRYPPPGRGPLHDRRARRGGGRLPDGDCHPGAVTSDRRRPLRVPSRPAFSSCAACPVPFSRCACTGAGAAAAARCGRARGGRSRSSAASWTPCPRPRSRSGSDTRRRSPLRRGRLRELRKGRKRPAGRFRSIRRPDGWTRTTADFSAFSGLGTDRGSMRGHHERFVHGRHELARHYTCLENLVHKRDFGAFDGETRTRTGDTTISDGETRTRTGDTTIFSRVLYQLSYLAVEPRE